MATRNVLLPLADDEGTNGWRLLSDRIAEEQAANSATNLPTVCQDLTIVNPETNAGDSRLQITSDPVTFTPAYSLLPEEERTFSASCYNNMSTMDKWIRLVDGAGAPIDGNARVTINFA